MTRRRRGRWFRLALGALPLFASLAQDAGAADGAGFAFVDVNVVPMDRETVLPSHTVLVRDGAIVALGPAGTIDIPADAVRIEGGGRAYLMPGLADMHVHLRRSGRSWLPLFLANGVTTVLNMGGTPNHLAWRQEVADGVIDGPTIYTAGPHIGRYRPLSPDEAERLVVEQHDAGYDLIKVYSSSPGDWSREAYERVIATAKARGIAVTGHAPRNLPFDVVLEVGSQSMSHTEELLYTHFKNLDEARVPALAEKAAARGLWLMTSFATFEGIARQWGKPDAVEHELGLDSARYLHPDLVRIWRHENSYVRRRDAGEWIEAALKFHHVLIKALHDAGVGLMTGTDAPLPVMMPGVSMHREIAILTEAGLTPYQALRAATRNPGDYMHDAVGRPERFGRVAPGYRADLLLLSGNPLADLSVLGRPLGVMARGRWFDRAALDAMLANMAREFAKPWETIDAATGTRLAGEALKTLLAGATLVGRDTRDTPYRVRLAPDGRATTITGPIGDLRREGTWRVDGDEYCLRNEGRKETCLAGVLRDDAIAWYLDVGGWFNEYYVKVGEDRFVRP